jgi:hypothetical protein
MYINAMSKTTNLQQRIAAFVQLGNLMQHLSASEKWPGFESGLTEDEYEQALREIEQQHIFNGWFTPDNIQKALTSWATLLQEKSLNDWVSSYNLQESSSPKTIAIICAGNIPMVGFHDILCTLITGNKAYIKLSSDDARLIPLFLFILMKWEPSFQPLIQWAEGKMSNFDKVIATGSNNTLRYFEAYFGKYPHILRHSRTSVAILDGTETAQELNALGHDIFDYFGLGCRNVCKVYLPLNYDLNLIIAALLPFQEVAKHNKYANNYDYNKAVWLLNNVPLLENGFMLFKEDKGIVAPTSSLFYEYYEDKESVLRHLESFKDQLQCVVGHGHIPFGKAQCPQLNGYADEIDTLHFLIS